LEESGGEQIKEMSQQQVGKFALARQSESDEVGRGQMNSQNCKVPPNHPPIFLGPSPLTPPTNGHCIIYQLVPLAFPGKNSSESLSVSQVFLSLFFFCSPFGSLFRVKG